jgi:hypothetical protein
MAGAPRQSAGDQAGAAGQVDRPVFGRRTRCVDDERDDLVGMEFPGAGETGRLSAELVDDRALVRVVFHGGHGNVPIAKDKWLRSGLGGDRSDNSQRFAVRCHA